MTVHQTSRNTILSEQVGRVGYHFPSAVVDQACRLLGARLENSSNVHFQQESRHRYTRYPKASAQTNQGKRKHQVSSVIDLVEDEMSQKELDAQAASTIRELFPKIPEKDVQQIVTRAFKKV